MELVDKLSNRQYIDGEWVESSNKNTRDIIILTIKKQSSL